MLRVLLVAAAYPTPRQPSFGVFVQRQADALAELGHEIDRAVLTTRAAGRVRSPLKYLQLGAIAVERALVARHDLVWAHFLVPPGAIARRAARLRGLPYVVTAHGTDVANAERDRRLRRLTGRVVGEAAAVIAVSDALAARLERLFPEVAGRLHRVSAGVDLRRFHDGDRDVAAAALGWDEPEPRLLALGNLVEAKNLERLLEGFARFREDHGGALAFVGQGPLEGRLRRRAQELGVARHVRFAGEAAPEEVPRWLRAATAACLVSEREGFGLAAVEALACGRAVAVSRGAGAAPLVEPGVTGALCDPLDPASIARALAEASVLRPGAAARAAAEPYALEREARRVEAILRAAAAQASTGVTSKLRS